MSRAGQQQVGDKEEGQRGGSKGGSGAGQGEGERGGCRLTHAAADGQAAVVEHAAVHAVAKHVVSVDLRRSANGADVHEGEPTRDARVPPKACGNVLAGSVPSRHSGSTACMAQRCPACCTSIERGSAFQAAPHAPCYRSLQRRCPCKQNRQGHSPPQQGRHLQAGRGCSQGVSQGWAGSSQPGAAAAAAAGEQGPDTGGRLPSPPHASTPRPALACQRSNQQPRRNLATTWCTWWQASAAAHL